MGNGTDVIAYWSLYTTPIDVGNPPITFQALIHTTWGPLFVLPVNSSSDPLEESLFHPLYDSTKSSTYHADLTPCRMLYLSDSSISTMGKVSHDNLRIAGISTKRQKFEEAIELGLDPMTRDDILTRCLVWHFI